MQELTKKILAMRLIELCDTVLLKDISVKAYIKYVGISKQTFYNHFRDKYDLMNYAFEIAAQLIDDSRSTSLQGIYDSIIKMADVCMQHRKFYIQLVKYETQNSFIQHFILHCEKVYKCSLAETCGTGAIDEQLLHIIHIYCVGICTFFIEWIRDGMKAPPDRLANTMMACMPPRIKNALDLKPD